MNLSAVIHRPTTEFVYPCARDTLWFQLITARDDARRVSLIYWERYETDPKKRKRIPLEATLRDAYRAYYRATIKTEHIAAYIRYGFLLESNSERIWYGANGFQTSEPQMNQNFFEFLWPNLADGYCAPSWSSRQIYYQIFPERYCRGNPKLSPRETVAWGTAPTRENFMGGDIPGILQKLDHIQALGATCIYLTPIFSAPSNHKYDTVDYYEIDPHFGTKADFKRLVEDIHKRGMRIILDGVFNHCGYYWPPFQDVAINGATSRFADWFFIRSYPVETDPCSYDCVGHYKWMPKINLSNRETQAYFIEVGKYWLREFGIDGWRLDVADEVPMAFWEAFAAEIRACFPSAILIGETWGDAHRLVCTNRLDSAMNYLFKDAVTDWLARKAITAKQFDHRINQMLALYSTETNLRMYNPLDSHDTSRFLFECGEDTRRFKLAVALQMTFPGCPAVYYGDEIGLTGTTDPDCRRAMTWEPEFQKQEIFSWYQALTALRKHSVSLMEGNYRTVLCDADAYGFCRTAADESSLVLINAGEKLYHADITMAEDGPQWQEAVIEENDELPQKLVEMESPGILRADIPAYSVKIYQSKRK